SRALAWGSSGRPRCRNHASPRITECCSLAIPAPYGFRQETPAHGAVARPPRLELVRYGLKGSVVLACRDAHHHLLDRALRVRVFLRPTSMPPTALHDRPYQRTTGSLDRDATTTEHELATDKPVPRRLPLCIVPVPGRRRLAPVPARAAHATRPCRCRPRGR